MAHHRVLTPRCFGTDSVQVKVGDDSFYWLRALADHLEEAGTGALDLRGKGLKTETVQTLLEILSESEITELNLERNCLRGAMKVLSPLLSKTRIKKLNVSQCDLTDRDLLDLAEVLEESQIIYLDVSRNGRIGFNQDQALKYIANLKKSKVTSLILCFGSFCPASGRRFFYEEFFKTSTTCLDVSGSQLDWNDLGYLFANLCRSAVTDLNLGSNRMSLEVFQELCRRLVDTKIEKLDLSQNRLKDDELNSLVDGLVGSKVTHLNLDRNMFTSFRHLFTKLKDTQIRALSLSLNLCLTDGYFIDADSLRCSSLVSLTLFQCPLGDQAGVALMESLRFSDVTKLDIRATGVGSLTVKKFAEKINDINLLELDISHNPLPLDAFFTLGNCLKQSMLSCIDVSGIKLVDPIEAIHLISFLKLIEGSSVRQIEMNDYPFIWRDPVYNVEMPVNTTLTELDLYRCHIRDDVSSLLSYLKSTTVCHLNLSENDIADGGATILAEHLKETHIRRLNLNKNLITSQGAVALALSLKDTNLLHLHLNGNLIQDAGLEHLAANVKDTYMSTLDVLDNPGKRVLVVDRMMLQNKVKIAKLLKIFKPISPQTNHGEFCFDGSYNGSSIRKFLEKCMWFYKTVTQRPHALSVLLEEMSISFSKEQISRLVFEEFPVQFSRFIACNIEADLRQHVEILGRAEAMSLTAIVESLLLHRPVYMLDEGQGILHPYVYKLLLKYKQPICNLTVEPHGVTKIINYFTQHPNVEGGQDLIHLLHHANIL